MACMVTVKITCACKNVFARTLDLDKTQVVDCLNCGKQFDVMVEHYKLVIKPAPVRPIAFRTKGE